MPQDELELLTSGVLTKRLVEYNAILHTYNTLCFACIWLTHSSTMMKNTDIIHRELKNHIRHQKLTGLNAFWTCTNLKYSTNTDNEARIKYVRLYIRCNRFVVDWWNNAFRMLNSNAIVADLWFVAEDGTILIDVCTWMFPRSLGNFRCCFCANNWPKTGECMDTQLNGPMLFCSLVLPKNWECVLAKEAAMKHVFQFIVVLWCDIDAVYHWFG